MMSDSSQHPQHPEDGRLRDEAIWARRCRLATAMRKAIEIIVATDAPEDELRAATERVERFVQRLETQLQRRVERDDPAPPALSTTDAFHYLSPLVGLANPVAPPITLWVEGNEVRGEVVFGAPYQGPPGHLHGGFVAALFDEALGHVQWTTGKPGMTGALKIRYHRPTPLYTTLHIEATVQRVHGRKIFTEARLYAGELLTAEAEGLFISMTHETFQELTTGKNRANLG
jgi:acyl-coenzyme A thioesterase PaaI-like protein